MTSMVWKCMFASTDSPRIYVSVCDGVAKLWLPSVLDPVIVPNNSSVSLGINTGVALTVYPFELTLVREPEELGGK